MSNMKDEQRKYLRLGKRQSGKAHGVVMLLGKILSFSIAGRCSMMRAKSLDIEKSNDSERMLAVVPSSIMCKRFGRILARPTVILSVRRCGTILSKVLMHFTASSSIEGVRVVGLSGRNSPLEMSI